MLKIRPYNPRRDKQVIKNLLVELLDSEKAVEPEWPSGVEIIEPYFNWMLRRSRKFSGAIFVADDDGQVIGFISVLGRAIPTDPDEYPREYALISDLIVHGPYRSQGIGRQLINVAEDYARQCGVSTIRLEASAGNTRGRQFYTRSGYRELVIEYFKKLN